MKPLRRVQIQAPLAPNNNNSNGAGDSEATAPPPPPPPDASASFSRVLRRQTATSVTEDQEPFMGVKVRRRTSLHREYKGDYLNVPSNPYVMKILEKQGDRQVLFADNILKFTGSGKIKRRMLLITDLAIYILDLDASLLKRRVVLTAIENLCLSELSDNFLAIIIPSEYDCLLASTRKTEIVTVLVEATKNKSDYGIEVVFSNRKLLATRI
ncbi:myosin IC heavy chain isoform X2 [Amborella trichopoda]|uniref:myosin IC heavy chain isoform X2 n=1 Tax=Amborella trichopoda TaxID=13333 RepID=UPI0005D3B7FE|nr:myosin IC heavy chain isoform X2 [Amborella trichopoda]|eukprot:XP_020518187.1 myosin IC heavy chain isoform X2 [Amborella trichopoda]